MNEQSIDIREQMTTARIKCDSQNLPEKIHFDLSSLNALNKTEDVHFWSKIRQYIVSSMIQKFAQNSGRFLDIGCGNGSLIRHIEYVFPTYAVAGIDGYIEALLSARNRSSKAELFLQDLSAPWIETGPVFDAMACMDVLEHLDHPEIAIREATSRLSDEGIMIVSLPAGKKLWSKRDVFLGHRKRYNRRECIDLMRGADMEVLHCSYAFSYLYIPMWIYRKLLFRLLRLSLDQVETYELTVFPILNKIVIWFGKLEIMLSTLIPIPFGTSVYCVARKKQR